MADTLTTLAKARALIEAHGRAERATHEGWLMAPHLEEDLRMAAKADSPAIAEALVEAVGLLRDISYVAFAIADRADSPTLDVEIGKARAFLAKHGETT